MLTVEITSMPASRIVVDVLPPLLVAASRARSCAPTRRRGPRSGAGDDAVEVHLLERACRGGRASRRGTTSRSPSWPRCSPDRASRRTRRRRRRRARAAAGPRRASRTSCRRPERRRGRPACVPVRRRSVTLIDSRSTFTDAIEGEVELEDVDAGIAEDPERAVRRCARRHGASTSSSVMPRARRRRGQPAAGRCAPRCAGRGRTRMRSPRRLARARRRRARSRSR